MRHPDWANPDANFREHYNWYAARLEEQGADQIPLQAASHLMRDRIDREILQSLLHAHGCGVPMAEEKSEH